jgi:hypothetical protein
MDHQGASLTAAQVGGRERIGGGDEFRRAVGADFQGGQIAAGRMAGVTGCLEVASSGVEVAGLTAGWGDGVGVTLAHRVNV